MTMFNPVQLIEEVKKRPPLYRIDQPADRDERLSLWKEVGAVIYHDWNTFNKATAYDRVLQLQKKWRSLRDAYNRELRSRRNRPHQNRKVYRYFKKMTFLGGYDGNVSEENDPEPDSDLVFEVQHMDNNTEDVLPQEPVKVKKTKRRKCKREPSLDSIQPPEEMEMSMFPMELAPENETDSDRLFLLSFLPEMRQLPVNVKMWVRAQIANIMQEAVSCHYNNTAPGSSAPDKGDFKRQRHDSSE